jgi:prepilin-type processing-associated H-X9-DG protein
MRARGEHHPGLPCCAPRLPRADVSPLSRRRAPRPGQANRWAGVIPGAQVPSVRSPGDFSGASALVLGHCGPHLPNDNIVTDADAMSSAHTGGVQFLFGDGSVHMISNGIGQVVYDALATRAGGEVVDGSAY